MNAMGLKLFVETEKMCMFHKPAGFWIFFHSKSHYPVSRLGRPGPTNEEKVNCSFSKFVNTSREQTLPQNAPFPCKSLSKSEKNEIF
jgi:hypothetical protein